MVGGDEKYVSGDEGSGNLDATKVHNTPMPEVETIANPPFYAGHINHCFLYCGRIEITAISSMPLTHSLEMIQVENHQAREKRVEGPSHLSYSPQDGGVIEMSRRLKDFLISVQYYLLSCYHFPLLIAFLNIVYSLLKYNVTVRNNILYIS